LAVAISLLPAGAAALTFTTAANTSVQLGVDATVRGRVMALYLLCFMGGTPLGAPAIGMLADTFGPRAGLLGGGAVCVLLAVALGALFARRVGLRPRPATKPALRPAPHPRPADHLTRSADRPHPADPGSRRPTPRPIAARA